ncbi:unnamed protein product, partial [Sphacelaria rigidula]
ASGIIVDSATTDEKNERSCPLREKPSSLGPAAPQIDARDGETTLVASGTYLAGNLDVLGEVRDPAGTRVRAPENARLPEGVAAAVDCGEDMA